MPEEVRTTTRLNRDLRRDVSRRQFLQYSAVGLSAALLAASRLPWHPLPAVNPRPARRVARRPQRVARLRGGHCA